MATVRFSEELRRDIRRNAERLFDKRIKDARDLGVDTWPQMVATQYTNAVEGLLHGVPQEIRDIFLEYGDDFTLGKIFVAEGEPQLDVSMTNTVTKFPLPRKDAPDVAKKLGFLKCERTYGRGMSVSIDGREPQWQELCALAVDRRETITTANEERDKFVANVAHIVGSYATLAPALKAWPPLWDLVPEYKRDKHKEIVERKRSTVEDVVGDIDLDSMTATTVASKLSR